jgi:hypothetical protein
MQVDGYFRSSSKKGRGLAKASIALIDAMYDICEEAQPITGRGVGYKLFSLCLIKSMSRGDMAGVYRLLKIARENGTIPWDWIVDETRELEIVSTWANPAAFVRCVARSYRLDFWQHQPVRVQVWSEKGTVRGVLQPILDEYGVGFNPVHGFNSATNTHYTAEDDDGRPLIILYIGDFDPSGMYMSEVDLPKRFAKYGGHHIDIKRIALTRDDCRLLGRKPAFNVKEKSKDPRAPWFRKTYGQLCWELDAMDPNELRWRVEAEIMKHIDQEAWDRCQVIYEAECESLRHVLDKWNGA